VDDTATATVDVINPDIDLTKTCSPDTQFELGEITWTIVINNTGDVDLNVTAYDSLHGWIYSDWIAAGGSETIEITNIDLIAGCYVNTVTATGYHQLGEVSATATANCCVTEGICVLIADEDFIDNDGQAIEEAAAFHGVTPDILINDQGKRPSLTNPAKLISVPTERDNPWFYWNEYFPGDVVLLETGQVKDEGLFCLTDVALAELAKRGYTLEDFVYGRIPQSKLDKIPGVMPLRDDCLRQLVGKKCIVVVYDSDISINYDPINGNLQGARYGLTFLEFLAVTNPGTIKESTDSTSLLDIWVEVLPIPDPFPALNNCDCPVQNEVPDDVSIELAEWSNGVLTVHAKSSEGYRVPPPTLRVSISYPYYPGINPGTLTSETILGEMTWINKDRYEFTYNIATNIVGWTITVSSSRGGAYNTEIKLPD
jgi:hypothetical protein